MIGVADLLARVDVNETVFVMTTPFGRTEPSISRETPDSLSGSRPVRGCPIARLGCLDYANRAAKLLYWEKTP